MDQIPTWVALLAAGALGMFVCKIGSSINRLWKKQTEQDEETRRWAERGNKALDRTYDLMSANLILEQRIATLEAMPRNQWKPNK